MIMSRTIIAAAIVSIAGCGGGGDDGRPDTSPLQKYVGAHGYCDGHERVMMTITQPSGNVLSMSQRTDYYSVAGCTGAILASEVMSDPANAVYISTGTTTVTGIRSDGVIDYYGISSHEVDRIRVSSAPSTKFLRAGPGLEMIGGRQCIVYSDGGKTCFSSDAPPGGSTDAGLAIAGPALLLLNATAQGYALDASYSR